MASSLFREDASRAVYVTGEISEDLVHKLCPVITGLRFSSEGPITVFIDSRGGSIRSAEHIQNLLRAVNQDKKSHQIITVATTQAKSAAAMMLANGDYALAYQHAEIMFHGSRIPEEAEITTEKASNLAEVLGSINEGDALTLAEVMFPRLVFLHIFFRRQYDKLAVDIEQFPGAPLLALLIRSRVRPLTKKLVEDALKQLAELDKLSDHIFSGSIPLINEGDPQGKIELEIIKRILDYEEKRNDLSTWNLTNGGLEQIRRDFLLLSKHYSKYALDINKKVHQWGRFFLDGALLADFEKITDETAKGPFLVDHATSSVESLWSFAVMLANILQGKDCNITAREAYWMGLIDEVVGSNLPNKRLAVESAESVSEVIPAQSGQ